jgi:xylulokinase
MDMALLLGVDIGSSSVKAALLDAETGRALATAAAPDTEMEIRAPHPGWAEQDPDAWWGHLVDAVRRIRDRCPFDPDAVAAVGIGYQMHGLVLVDDAFRPLRPAIIWCDSRAVEAGNALAAEVGPDRCRAALRNLPGNFTAAKLRWVRDHEPDVFKRARLFLLPGDYIALKLTGEARTTTAGLSEAILWDYGRDTAADFVLDRLGASGLAPDRVPIFGPQGALTAGAAEALGLKAGTPVTYRAGDQPNNALSLNVRNPGEAAVTAGTSGVVYAVTDAAAHDPDGRVNTFVHVTHAPDAPRYGVLLCVNGTGILNSWLKRALGGGDGAGLTYEQMNALAAAAPPGADGLRLLPYGNGAERTLGNRDPGAALLNWHFNRHTLNHLLRAAQEGIVFALEHGLDVMRGMGLHVRTVRAGHANLFLSPLFAETFAATTGAAVELFDTDGAQGAARGAGIGAGLYADAAAAFAALRPLRRIEPDPDLRDACRAAYTDWTAAHARWIGARASCNSCPG